TTSPVAASTSRREDLPRSPVPSYSTPSSSSRPWVNASGSWGRRSTTPTRSAAGAAAVPEGGASAGVEPVGEEPQAELARASTTPSAAAASRALDRARARPIGPVADPLLLTHRILPRHGR